MKSRQRGRGGGGEVNVNLFKLEKKHFYSISVQGLNSLRQFNVVNIFRLKSHFSVLERSCTQFRRMQKSKDKSKSRKRHNYVQKIY